jgi:thiol-disulfide isomerase/thioredoxin
MSFIILFVSLFCQPVICESNDIVIHLKDKIIENSDRYVFTELCDTLLSEDGKAVIRFEVKETLMTAVNGLEYFKDKNNYSAHAPIYIDIFYQDSILISFDDDEDGIFDDRPIIKTSINSRNSSTILFKNKSNREKDLKINCEFQITNSFRGPGLYLLKIYYNTVSEGTADIKNKDYHFSLWKSLSDFNLRIDGQKTIRNNPIKISDSYYHFKEYDPVENFLILSPHDPTEKLYGTIEGFYTREKQLKEALSFHNVDLSYLKIKKYHLFYFWGHWCQPCMSKMDETSRILNNVNADVGVYHTSLLIENNKDEIQRVNNIVQDYKLPGISTLEFYTSHEVNTLPLITLFGNGSYPNFILVDSDYKILYVSQNSDIKVDDFLQSLK